MKHLKMLCIGLIAIVFIAIAASLFMWLTIKYILIFFAISGLVAVCFLAVITLLQLSE